MMLNDRYPLFCSDLWISKFFSPKVRYHKYYNITIFQMVLYWKIIVTSSSSMVSSILKTVVLNRKYKMIGNSRLTPQLVWNCSLIKLWCIRSSICSYIIVNWLQVLFGERQALSSCPWYFSAKNSLWSEANEVNHFLPSKFINLQICSIAHFWV